MQITLVQKSSVEHLTDLLRQEIRRGRWPVGSKVGSIRQLTRQMGASAHVVRQAIDALVDEGYLEKRHGSGTYVRSLNPSLDLSTSVAFCATVADHIYSTVSSLLTNHLHRSERILLNVDFYADNVEAMVTRAARSQIGTFIVQSDATPKAGKIFSAPVFDNSRLIALFNTRIPGLDREVQGVTVNHDLGIELIVDFLRREGHERILVVGTDNMLGANQKQPMEEVPCVGMKLVHQLESLEGTVRLLARGPARQRHDRHGFDIAAAVDALSGPEACTAVVGARDVDVADLQLALLMEAGIAPANFEWVGYGDTPWRTMAPVPLVSVDWNLEAVSDVLYELVSGQRECRPGSAVEIEPYLVTRQNPRNPAGAAALASQEQNTTLEAPNVSKS